jgi:hypothetical protein
VHRSAGRDAVPENRLPNLTELDAVPRPVFLQAAQGGTRTNSEGKKWLEARGVMVAADGTFAGQAPASRCRHCARNCSRRDAQAVGGRRTAVLRHARHHDAS